MTNLPEPKIFGMREIPFEPIYGYSTKQMLDYGNAVRIATLEAAIERCEVVIYDGSNTAEECADAIRTLISKNS